MFRVQTADLLVATPEVMGDFFDKSVIMMLESDDTGSLGVMLNRPSTTTIDLALPEWVDLVSPPADLFIGGPVKQNGAICVAKLRPHIQPPPGWRRLSGDLGLLQLDTPVEIVNGAFLDMRIFAGYCGWGAEQLEGEMIRGSWQVCSGRPEDLFTADPNGLWHRILRRQGGDLAMLSSYTSSFELN